MKTIFFKFLMLLYKLGLFLSPVLAVASVLLFVFSLGLFSSCSKEAFSDDEAVGEDDEAYSVVWDNTKYKIYYIRAEDLPHAPSLYEDESFYIRLFLEDNENPHKEVSLSCCNYIYGEKVDLTTDKYQSKINFTDGNNEFDIRGGSSIIKQGSYYQLIREGSHITLTISLSYSGNNGYIHKLNVKYSGVLPDDSYLPAENWQDIPKPLYTFGYDDMSFKFSDFPQYAVHDGRYMSFYGGLYNAKYTGSISYTIYDFKYDEKIDISSNTNNEISLNLSPDRNSYGTTYTWKRESVLPGSFLRVEHGQENENDVIVLDARCKNQDGSEHHVKIEYNVYK